MTNQETTQYGVVYPDGTTDWNTTVAFGAIDTPALRANFQEQYALRLTQLGVPSVPKLTFVTRTCTTTYSDPVEIVDPVVAPPVVVPDPVDTNTQVPGETPSDSPTEAPE